MPGLSATGGNQWHSIEIKYVFPRSYTDAWCSRQPAGFDPVTPVAAAREIVDALPAGRAGLEVIEGAGHFPWRDAPDRYWPLVSDFVATARLTRA